MDGSSVRLLLVCALSGTGAGLFLHHGAVVWFGDAHTYVNYAAHLLRNQIDPNLYWRTAGYPIVLIVTGVLATGSLAGLLALQALSAAFIPVGTYMILERVNATVALLIAILVAASTVGYAWMTTIYPDQLYMAALVVVALLQTKWLLRPAHPAILYGLTGTCLGLVLMRPVGYAVALLCLLLTAMRRKALAHILICSTIFVGVIAAVGAHRTWRAGDLPGMLGRQLFFNIYMQSGGLDTNGPFAGMLRLRLLTFFRDEASRYDLRTFGPQFTEEAYRDLFGRYAGRPEQQVDAIFTRPNRTYYWVMFAMSDIALGKTSDQLFLWTSLEFMWRHPATFIAIALDNYKRLVVGPALDAPYIAGFSPGMSAPLANQFVAPIEERWTAAVAETDGMRQANRAFAQAYELLLPASYVLMLIGAAGFLATPGIARTTGVTVFALHTCNVLPLAILVDAQFRYQSQSVPLALIGAGIGAWRLASWASSGYRGLIQRTSAAQSTF